MSWSLLLADLSGTTKGEINNASDRQVSFAFNRLNTGSFRVRLDHPLAEDLLQGDSLIKVYQRLSGSSTPSIRMVAEIVSVEEVAGENNAGSLAVTYAEAGFWRLSHRLIGKSAAGYTRGTAVAPVTRGSIAQNVIETVNAERDTGVRIGTITDTASGYVGPWYYKPVSEAITELSATLDGFDFRFDPIEPVTDAAGLAVSRFRTAGAIGQSRPNTVFEFGTGKRNIKGLKRQVSRDGLLTKGYHLPPGFPETSEPVASTENTTAIAARGLHEALVTSDITVADLRAALVNEHVAIRKQPRQLITFEPTSYGSEFFADYEVGDVVVARARVGGSTRFNANFRIYGCDVSINDNGLATYSLTLINSE